VTPPSGHDLARSHRDVLGQGLRLLDVLDAATYARAPEPFQRHGAGSHLRHCLDYYDCFLEGLSSGRVDYDARRRDERVERDPVAAGAAIRRVLDGLSALAPGDGDRPLSVRMDAEEGVDDAGGWTTSTVARELRFLLSHTVHHYALIAWALRFHGVEPGPTFGVAPSTLRHWAALGDPVAAPDARGRA
jgi:hypothetical protein